VNVKRNRFRTLLSVGLCCAIILFSSNKNSEIEAQVNRSGKAKVRNYITPKTQKAIDRGLEFLAASQHDDGSFGSGSAYPRNVAVTALSGMAFLSAGSTPGRGRYGKHVDQAVSFIVASAKPSGYIISSDSASHGPLYGHGFATLFLAEVYGMSRNKSVHQVLKKAVKLIVNSQNKEGGWRYYPESKDADISVTVCLVMALRAARNCGIFVPKNTIDRCIAYVKRSQNPDGGFRYQVTRKGESRFPLSAAGIVALYSSGQYKGKEIQRSLQYLLKFQPRGDIFHYEIHYFYGHYYAVQAMWHAGENYWKRWYPSIRSELLRRQLNNGSWPDTSICNEYGTAMACIVLQMPNDSVPIFQK